MKILILFCFKLRSYIRYCLNYLTQYIFSSKIILGSVVIFVNLFISKIQILFIAARGPTNLFRIFIVRSLYQLCWN